MVGVACGFGTREFGLVKNSWFPDGIISNYLILDDSLSSDIGHTQEALSAP